MTRSFPLSIFFVLLIGFSYHPVVAQNGSGNQGPYFSVFGGFGEVEDYDFVGPATFQGSFQDGWGMGFAVGSKLCESVRGEVDFSFRDVEGEDWIVNGNPGSWSGPLASGSLMTNLLYDLDCAALGRIRPYFGGGLGFSHIDGNLTTRVGTLRIDEDNFSWQGIAGGSISAGNHELFAEYRYQDSGSVDIINGAGNSIGSEDVVSNFVFIGLRLYR